MTATTLRSSRTPIRTPIRTTYHGLRMTADEYFELPDDGRKYELIDGVVIMSPSATPRHQLVSAAIFRPLADHVERNDLGVVLFETDVKLKKGLVYRPEMLFIAAERVGRIKGRIEIVPDVVVEIISPATRSLDTETKRRDYEKAGVREFWLIDPAKNAMTFFRLKAAKFVRASAGPGHYESQAVPGFRLDLEKVRAAFRAL